MTILLALPAVALLGVVAWRDLATRLIPDGPVICIALLGAMLRASEGPLALIASAAAAAVLFLTLAWLCSRGLLGGGDVKLAAAIALGLAPASVPAFVVVTAIAGGVLAIGYLLAGLLLPAPRRLAPSAPPLRRILAAEQRRIHRRGPLPYGVAIAFAGALLLLKTYGA